MHSLPTSTDFWGLSHFWKERDYNTVPFERRFISQSLWKSDCSLSQNYVRKAPYFECFFFFLQQITGIFFAFLGAEG